MRGAQSASIRGPSHCAKSYDTLASLGCKVTVTTPSLPRTAFIRLVLWSMADASGGTPSPRQTIFVTLWFHPLYAVLTPSPGEPQGSNQSILTTSLHTLARWMQPPVSALLLQPRYSPQPSAPTHSFMGTTYTSSTGVAKPHRSCSRSSSWLMAATPRLSAISSMSVVGPYPLVTT